MMTILKRIAVLLLVAVALDWAPELPPYPLLTHAGPASAQAPVPQPVPANIPPPDRWHPYQGGTNCVQVVDSDGNFNCSPLVQVNPATGVLTLLTGFGPISTALGALVIAPTPTLFTALGNDLVIVKSSLTSVAPTGPGVGGLTLRVRPSPRVPGYCNVVAIAGNAFGSNLEFPLAFLNPATGFFMSAPNGNSGPAPAFDWFTVDIPGGPGGC